MPIYTYEVFDDGGRMIEIFEAEQDFGAETLEKHPITGERMRKIFTPPGVNTTYSDWGKKLEPGRLSQAGFTRYEKDKSTGRYFKSNEGTGPSELDSHAGEH